MTLASQTKTRKSATPSGSFHISFITRMVVYTTVNNNNNKSPATTHNIVKYIEWL